MEYNEITAFVFAVLSYAKEAQNTIDAGEGFGGSGSQETKHYTDIYMMQDGTYIILADEVTTKYLGTPETIQIPVTTN